MKKKILITIATFVALIPVWFLVMAGTSQEDAKITLYCFAGIVVYTILLSIILKHCGKSKTFTFEGKRVKYSDVVDQKLLDFLETKGYSNEKIIEYILRYSCVKNVKIRFILEEGKPTAEVAELFSWISAPEGCLFWGHLHDGYELRKRREEQK